MITSATEASPELAEQGDAFRWRILETAGEGASAVVHRAEGRDGTVVALKVAKADEPWLGREAALLASAARRWGPRLVDAGRVPAGVVGARAGASYVATTWTEGTSLAARVARAGSKDDRARLAMAVAHGVARGLEELHGVGIRHGDVKLGNVLVVDDAAPRLRERADERTATLIDLGLAAAVDGSEAIGGTPRYLAPEILRGEAATPSADLYALGIVLAEIVVPALVEVAEPRSRLREAFGEGEVGLWIEALVAESAGARPAASWIAERAAQRLGLELDPAEVLAARESSVRRAYLALRAGELAQRHRSLDPAIDGAARAWLDDARWRMSRMRVRGSSQADAPPIPPMDPLDIARWLVALVGPAAASWPSLHESEGTIAERLLALCRVAPPEAWTIDDVRPPALARVESSAMKRADVASDSVGTSPSQWLELTRALLKPRPGVATLASAERQLAVPGTPSSLAVDLAGALLRRGEIGRAFAALVPFRDASPSARLLFAEIARRRGDVEAAATSAMKVQADGTADLRDGAKAVVARLAWDRGAVDEAETLLGDARGAAAAEVRALVAYARSDFERGLRILAEAVRDSHDAVGAARLEATRGMLEHARGNAEASLTAFAAATELAAREGAVIEEATYLTGLAAAAVDTGAVGRALVAATRASLLWERLGRPSHAARALLSRASAFALVGASHEADRCALLAASRARACGDRRAAAFARWAMVETRIASDELACTEAEAAERELSALDPDPAGDDRIRARARCLVWARGADPKTPTTTTAERAVSDVEASAGRALLDRIDGAVSGRSPTTRWEWWGARAVSLVARGMVRTDGARVLAELVALVDVAAPIGSRGPALAAGARLAAELGDGDVARRLETARRHVADALRAGTPPEHRASLSSIVWARSTSPDAAAIASASFGAAQVEQLESIARALSSRDRLKPLLEQVLDTMVLWTGVERGLLLLRAPDDKLVPRAARNLARRDLGGEQMNLSMGIAKRAMDEGQAVIATDAYAQIGELHASVHALRLRSVLAVPLIARGDVLGVVYLDDRIRRGAFGPNELAWVRLVASQAALAIADARDQTLLRRAVRRAERANAELARQLGAREAELVAVRAELAQGDETRFRYDEIAGRSEPVRAMLRLVDRVTVSAVPVLLVGESGTGKELVARAIHKNGPRASKAFISENCGAVPEALLESTLFGHVRGAFTGASATRAGLFDVADGGTLFLDEIGEMPLSMQTKLLRVLQNGEVRPVGTERTRRVDVRIIGATHRDLGAMVSAGTFREDLFYRLNVVSIRVPPLRERVSDIALLVAHFVEKHAGKGRIKVTRAAMDRLMAFPWPGNVRQLENEVRRALVLADERIDVDELSDEVARGGPATARDAGLGLKARVDALEAQLVRDALARTKGNQTKAAEALGVSRFGLQKMMRRLGIKGLG